MRDELINWNYSDLNECGSLCSAEPLFLMIGETSE